MLRPVKPGKRVVWTAEAESATAAAEALLALCFAGEARRLAVDLPGTVQAAVQLAASAGGSAASDSLVRRAAALRLLAVLTREPAACEALARRTRCSDSSGGRPELSGLSSIPLDVALHALLQDSCDEADRHAAGSRDAADAVQFEAAVVLSNVADAALAATQGPGRFRAVTAPVRLQVRVILKLYMSRPLSSRVHGMQPCALADDVASKRRRAGAPRSGSLELR